MRGTVGSSHSFHFHFGQTLTDYLRALGLDSRRGLGPRLLARSMRFIGNGEGQESLRVAPDRGVGVFRRGEGTSTRSPCRSVPSRPASNYDGGEQGGNKGTARARVRTMEACC